MRRTRAERRHNDWTKARRKWRLDVDTALESSCTTAKSSYYERFWLTYKNLHQYSKNKIYCSCWMCVQKTNPKRFKHLHGAPMNWSIADRRKIEDMNYQEQELYQEITGSD